jgi:hypothetical protein
MPITKMKAEVKPKPKKVALITHVKAVGYKGVLSGYETLVDELAALEQVITPEVQKALKHQKRLQEELRAVADKEVAADAKITFRGSTHNFTVTEKGEQRSITDIQECRKALGDKLFYQCVKVNLGDLDKYLTEDQKGFIATTRTGPRKGQLVTKE